jgi:hypothetical protein
MRTSSEKILILILFGWAPFLLYSQGSSSENDLLKHKRPPLPKHTGFIETVLSNNHEEKEERETPPANTFSTHTRKKKLKKREITPTPEPSPNVENPINSDLESEKKNYLTKQGLSLVQSLESSKTGAVKISKILLTHPIPDVREEAARALGRMKKGSPALQKAISNDSFNVKRQAFIALEKVGGKDVLNYFVAGIKSTDTDIRLASFKGLGKSGSPYARELLIRYGIGSSDTSIIAVTLAGLGNFSKQEDLSIFKKYIPSEIVDLQIGAIKGLGNSKAQGTLELLTQALNENNNLLPEVIYSISQKNNLHSTLLLLKIMQITENESYRLMIQKELNKRNAYGRYAIVKTPSASLRNEPKTNSTRVAVLLEGDVARVKNITEKLFKAKMNNEVLEDRYYLLEAINNKESYTNPIMQGWAFGPKLSFITINKPSIYTKMKKSSSNPFNLDEESEDEKSLPPFTTVDKKKGKSDTSDDKSVNEKKKNTNTNPEFDDEDDEK